MAVALFRLVEVESGCIKVDDVDIGELGLSDVRGRENAMSIIPQDPFIAGTTLRDCIDPFGLASDEDVLEALQYANVGQGILAGFSILFCAMILDRIVQGARK